MPARPPPVPPASRCAAEGSFAGNDAAGGGEQAAVGYQAHGGCNLAVERAVAIQERNDLAQRGVRRGDGGARVVVVARGGFPAAGPHFLAERSAQRRGGKRGGR